MADSMLIKTRPQARTNNLPAGIVLGTLFGGTLTAEITVSPDEQT
jgi:hypothetical protein